MKKTAALFGALAVAAILAAWRRVPVRTAPGEDGHHADTATQDVAALKREVHSLERMAMAQALGRAAAGPAPVPAEKTRPPRLSPSEQRRALTSALEAHLAGDTIDAGWSRARVEEITHAFVASLSDATVLSVECASTICKAVVENSDLESQATLMDRASDIEGLDVEKFYVFDKDATPPRTTIYLGRPGHKLLTSAP